MQTTKTFEEIEKTKEPFITVYRSIGGWKSQLMVWYEEDQMYDVWNTGFYGYEDKNQAIKDAKAWAEAEEIPYVESKGE